MKPLVACALAVGCSLSAAGQPLTTQNMQLPPISDNHSGKWLGELCKFGSIRNNVFEADDIRKNAAYLDELLKRQGFRSEVWNTPSGKPFVYGELRSGAHYPTVLIYSHFDGVPVDAGQWSSDPYSPVLRNAQGSEAATMEQALAEPGSHRLYGRSVADSKNAVISLLAALSMLRAEGKSPAMNIRLLLDGEEELESPHLRTTVLDHREQLAADLVVSASGETHQSGLPTIAFGVRGILTLDIVLHTATTDLHSGHFGNFAPNAALKLSRLLAGMKDADGRVLIPGFYDQVTPLSESEKRALSAVPPIERHIRDQFSVTGQETPGTLQELINQPTFNIRGIQAGYVGEQASNIIPARAEAAIDIRLVEGMDPDDTYTAVRNFIRSEGYHVSETAPTGDDLRRFGPVVELRRRGSFRATKTDMRSELPARVLAAVQRSTAEPWVIEPTEGGSLNFSVFGEMGIPLITLPVSNFDCNQHTHNENLRLDFFLRGIQIFRSLMELGS